MICKFRLNTHKVFLTYPQLDTDREDIKKHMEQVGGDLEEYIVAREHHKDGQPHMHTAVVYTNKLDIKNERAFDYKGHHPNIKTLKTKADFLRVVKYLKKEDPTPLMLVKTEDKCDLNKIMYKMLMDNGPDKLMMSGVIHPMHYSTYKRTYTEHKQALIEDKREDLPAFLDNPWTKPFQVDIDNKRCHYWIYSHKPNMGKTTWADQISTQYRAEFYNYSEKYQAQIQTNTECIIMDEFRGQLKVYELNQICDGKAYFTKKGLPNFRLEQKPIVIVCSNRMIAEVYKKELDVELVYARFNEIEAILPFNVIRQNGGTAESGK